MPKKIYERGKKPRMETLSEGELLGQRYPIADPDIHPFDRKGYHDLKYKYELPIKADMESMGQHIGAVNKVKGLNKGHALWMAKHEYPWAYSVRELGESGVESGFSKFIKRIAKKGLTSLSPWIIGPVGVAVNTTAEAFDATEIGREPADQKAFDEFQAQRRETANKKMMKASKGQRERTKQRPRSIQDLRNMAEKKEQ